MQNAFMHLSIDLPLLICLLVHIAAAIESQQTFAQFAFKWYKQLIGAFFKYSICVNDEKVELFFGFGSIDEDLSSIVAIQLMYGQIIRRYVQIFCVQRYIRRIFDDIYLSKSIRIHYIWFLFFFFCSGACIFRHTFRASWIVPKPLTT